MVFLLSTRAKNALSTKEAKRSLYKAPFSYADRYLTLTELQEQLTKSYTTYSAVPDIARVDTNNDKSLLLSMNDDKDNYITEDLSLLSHTQQLDIEPRERDLHHFYLAQHMTKDEKHAYLAINYPFLDPIHYDFDPALTIEDTKERLLRISKGMIFQLSDSHLHNDRARSHAWFSTVDLPKKDTLREATLRQFPEQCITNDRRLLERIRTEKHYSFSSYVRPLFVDLSIFHLSHKLYVSKHPLYIIGDQATRARLDYDKSNKDYLHEPMNLIRQDLLDETGDKLIAVHGSIAKAKKLISTKPPVVTDDTLLYSSDNSTKDTVRYILDNHKDTAGKTYHFGGSEATWFHIDADDKRLAYIQVSHKDKEPYLHSHIHNSRLTVIPAGTRYITYDTKYAPFALLDARVEGIIAPTGSGKNHFFGYLRHHDSITLVLVPTNAQVSALEYYRRVYSTERMPENTKDTYDSLQTAIDEAYDKDGRLIDKRAIVMTYDKFAATLARSPHIAENCIVVIDEMHRFIASFEAKYNSTRDWLFQELREQKLFKKLVLMSATIEVSHLYDIDPTMKITVYRNEAHDTKYLVKPYLSPEWQADHIFKNPKKVVMYINNVGVARTFVEALQEQGKTAGIIFGASRQTAEFHIAQEYDVLFLTEAGKEGISINYEVDEYIVVAEYNNFDKATFTDIQQAVARVRNTKKVFIAVKNSTLYNAEDITREIPSQLEAISMAEHLLSSRKRGLNFNLLSELYNVVDDKCIATSADDMTPKFVISERTILANRVEAYEEVRSSNIYNLEIMGNEVTFDKIQRDDAGEMLHTRLPDNESLKIGTLLRELVADIDAWDMSRSELMELPHNRQGEVAMRIKMLMMYRDKLGRTEPLLGIEALEDFISKIVFGTGDTSAMKLEDFIEGRAKYESTAHVKDVRDIENLENMIEKYKPSIMTDRDKLMCMYDPDVGKANKREDKISVALSELELLKTSHNISSLPRKTAKLTSKEALDFVKLPKKIDVSYMLLLIRDTLHCLPTYLSKAGQVLEPVMWSKKVDKTLYKFKGRGHSKKVVGYRTRDGTEVYQAVEVRARGADLLVYPQKAQVKFEKASYIDTGNITTKGIEL